MATKSAFKVGVRVRIIDTDSAYCNDVGNIVSLHVKTSGASIQLDNGDAVQFSLANLMPEATVTGAIVRQLAEARAESIKEEEAAKARRQREMVTRYINKRRDDAASTPVYGINPQHNLCCEGDPILYGKIAPGNFFSERITVQNHTRWGVPEVNVNWSALGAVTPEHALAFAAMLTTAAQDAIAIRNELEATLNIEV